MATKSNKAHAVDIEADAQPVASKDTLKLIAAAAEEFDQLTVQIANLDAQASTLSERQRLISEELLPALMQQAGMKKFELENGMLVNIKPFVRASIPSQSAIDKADEFERKRLIERREDCFKWLINNNAEPLIKTEVTAEFGKGEAKQAASALSILQKAGIAATLEKTVHNQTLLAFLREQLEAGTNIPAETFSLFTGSKAELKRAK